MSCNGEGEERGDGDVGEWESGDEAARGRTVDDGRDRPGALGGKSAGGGMLIIRHVGKPASRQPDMCQTDRGLITGIAPGGTGAGGRALCREWDKMRDDRNVRNVSLLTGLQKKGVVLHERV